PIRISRTPTRSRSASRSSSRRRPGMGPLPRRPPRRRAGHAPAELARGDVDRGDPARLDPERGIDVLALGARPDDQEVRLPGVAGVADLARDHAQALLATQEPAADALDPAQRLDAVADVHAHLGL